MSKNGEDIFGTREGAMEVRVGTQTPTGPGYHKKLIAKGELGKSSKIAEELEELQDAEKQGVRLMALIEASDLYGALKAFAEANGSSIEELAAMSSVTERAFKNGRRVAATQKTEQLYKHGVTIGQRVKTLDNSGRVSGAIVEAFIRDIIILKLEGSGVLVHRSRSQVEL